LQNLNGESLYIRGDFPQLSWTKGVEMQAAGVDQWTVQLSMKASQSTLAQFKILAGDSAWEVGANRVANLTALLDPYNATAASIQVFPWFGSQSGSYDVSQVAVFSPQLQNFRPVIVYTPPSYNENPYKKYDVLVMHDGQNLFNASTSSFGTAWNCQSTLDRLVVQGDMREVIVVGPYNTANRTYEYTYSADPTVHDGGGGDAYLDFLESSVYPWVQSTYRVRPLVPGTGAGSSRWAMLGSSLGGLLSCYAGWTRPNVYDRVGCMSSSFWWNSEDFNNTVLEHPPPAGPAHPDVVFYLDSGNAGPDNDDVVQTHTVFEHLTSAGYALNSTLYYYTQPGGQHSERYWGERFNIPMQDLFPPQVVDATPMHVGNYVGA
jgi:predicted alpha/beta superfamily hydrolase